MRRRAIAAAATCLAAFAIGIPSARATSVAGDEMTKRVPSVSAGARIEGLEKEANVSVYDGPKGFHAGVGVKFDRKGSYENPEATVTLDAWAYTFIFSLYFDDQPGPVSSPTVRLIHAVCDRSYGLC